MQTPTALGLLSPENVTAFWTLGAFLVVCTALLRRWSSHVRGRRRRQAPASTPRGMSTRPATSQAPGSARSTWSGESGTVQESAVAAVRGRLRYHLVRE